jgi:hypothetical protein
MAIAAEWDEKYGADGPENYVELHVAGKEYVDALRVNCEAMIALKRLEECITENFNTEIWDDRYPDNEFRRMKRASTSLPLRYLRAEEDVQRWGKKMSNNTSVYADFTKDKERALSIRHQAIQEYDEWYRRMDSEPGIRIDGALKIQRDNALEKLFQKHEASSSEKNPELWKKVRSRNDFIQEMTKYYGDVKLNYSPLDCAGVVATMKRKIKSPSDFSSEDRLLYFDEYVNKYLTRFQKYSGLYQIKSIYTALKLRDFLVIEYNAMVAENNSAGKN